MQKLDDKTIEKIKGIYALANHGKGGEVEAAQAALERIMARTGLTMAQISEIVGDENEKKDIFRFEFNNPWERKLLSQIYSYVLGVDKFSTYRYGRERKYIAFELTQRQYATMCEVYAILRLELGKAFDKTLSALIRKNKIYPPQTDKRTKDDFTPEELADLLEVEMMVLGMRRAVLNGPKMLEA